MRLDPEHKDPDELKSLENALFRFTKVDKTGPLPSLHTGTTIMELRRETCEDLARIVGNAITGVSIYSRLSNEGYVTGVGVVTRAAIQAAEGFARQIQDGGTPLDYEVEKAHMVVRHFAEIYRRVSHGKYLPSFPSRFI